MLLRDQRNRASYLHVTFASAWQNTHTTRPLYANTAQYQQEQELKLPGHVNVVNTYIKCHPPVWLATELTQHLRHVRR